MKLYLDNASTTEIHPVVINSIHESYGQYYGNPSSVHSAGYAANKRIQSARAQLLTLAKAKEHDLVFTSGGTESNNLAILGMINRRQKHVSEFICSAIEHPSVIRVYDHLKNEGAKVAYLPVTKQGIIDINALENMVGSDTHMVSIMHVNNETGIIQPVVEATNLIKKISPKTLVHIDGVQAFGKIDVNLTEVRADFYSVSAHKIGGPRGVGALFVKKGVNLSPILWGGGQENNLRSGTENTHGIIGFEKASLLRNESAMGYLEIMWKIRTELADLIMNNIQGVTFVEHADAKQQFPGIMTVCIDDVKSEVILRMLSEDGILLSSGSACSTRKTSASHVLQAMKVTKAAIDGTLRISFNETITSDQLNFFIQRLEIHVSKMRKMMKR